MKPILIGLLAFVAVAIAKIPPTPKNSYRVTPISIFNFKAARACEPKCSEDCTILTKCINDNPIDIDCRTQTSGQKPFCNDDLKQCDASNQFCPSESSGTCELTNGYYPNLFNCKSYYYCDEKKKIIYNCVGTSVYNALTEQCEVGVQCLNFDTTTGLCKGKNGLLIAHPVRRSLYVICSSPPVLEQCPNDNYEFDPLTTNCNFVCKKAGRFNDAVKNIDNDINNNIYYTECVRSGQGFVRYDRQCPTGTHFVVDDPIDPTGKGNCKLNSGGTQL